jgi:hypothetical protein
MHRSRPMLFRRRDSSRRRSTNSATTLNIPQHGQEQQQHTQSDLHRAIVTPIKRLSRNFTGIFKSRDDKLATTHSKSKQSPHVVNERKCEGYSTSLSSSSITHSALSSASPIISSTTSLESNHILVNDAARDHQSSSRQEETVQRKRSINTAQKTSPRASTKTGTSSNALRLSNNLVSSGCIKDKYDVGTRLISSGSSLLGRGKHSTVRLATVRSTGVLVAVKKYRLYQLGKSDIRNIRSEVEILSRISKLREEESSSSPVVHILDCYVDNDELCAYLVFDWLRGGELFDFVVDRICLREDQAKEVIRGVALALQLCHSKGKCTEMI